MRVRKKINTHTNKKKANETQINPNMVMHKYEKQMPVKES